ncbi:MAG: hypothetical protein [Olavius algarvensis Gamma 1 endosymbiont]|nr:MAG: hypothetical protein [Olavius algarvensis Gamma 1 endosymbiont]
MQDLGDKVSSAPSGSIRGLHGFSQGTCRVTARSTLSAHTDIAACA